MGETEGRFNLANCIKKALIKQGGDPKQSCGKHAVGTTDSAIRLKATARHPSSNVERHLARDLVRGDTNKIGAPHNKLVEDLVRERVERSGVHTTVTPDDFK